jgi:hypothetical protein
MSNRQNLRTITRGTYDLQKLRIQIGNRIVANFKARLGQKPGEKEETIEQEEKRVLDDIRRHYKLLTDGVIAFPRQAKFKGDEVISSYTELVMVSEYIDVEQAEIDGFNRLKNVLVEFPIFVEFLEGVKGVGPRMAAVIISEIDIHRAEYPSSLWKYAGIDVGSDGAGRSRRKEHLIDVEYTDKDGNTDTRKSITFNPFLKTKLVGVLAGSFLKAGEGPYRTIYDDYKHRLENNDRHADKSKGHIHNMALRYMIKRFLVDLYNVWRPMEGLPVAPEYSEAKLGKKHRKAA